MCSIKLYAFCHCERSEAVFWFARGLLRRKERSSQRQLYEDVTLSNYSDWLCSAKLGGLKPCLRSWKPFGLQYESALPDCHEVSQGFIRPVQPVKIQLKGYSILRIAVFTKFIIEMPQQTHKSAP